MSDVRHRQQHWQQTDYENRRLVIYCIQRIILTTGAWIDAARDMRWAVLEFLRFFTHHTGDAFHELLKDVLIQWKLANNVQSVTPDNVSDIILIVAKICNFYRNSTDSCHRIACFCHICSMAHVIHLAAKEIIEELSNCIHSVTSVVSAARSSLKRKDLFLKTREELKISIKAPGLEVTTR